MMILQTTTDSDSVKDIDTKAAEIDFLPPLSFVILNEVKNLLREPGGVENRCGVPDPSLRLRLRSG